VGEWWLYVHVKLEGKLGHLGYLGYRVSSHREVRETYMVIYRYPLIIFVSDYKPNSLNRQSTLQSRGILPFKNSHFAPFDSLTNDYFANRPINSYPQVYFSPKMPGLF